MIKKTCKYIIGDWVLFSHISEMRYDKNNQRIIFCKKIAAGENNIGQIVGAVRKHVGRYVSGTINKFNPIVDDYPEQPYLESKGTVLFFLIRTGMLNKSKMVSAEHLVLLDPLYQKQKRAEKEKHFKRFPWFDNGWGETTKRIVSNMMKGIELPRDSRGRFI